MKLIEHPTIDRQLNFSILWYYNEIEELESVAHPLHVGSSWNSVGNLIKWMLSTF